MSEEGIVCISNAICEGGVPVKEALSGFWLWRGVVAEVGMEEVGEARLGAAGEWQGLRMQIEGAAR